jgi:hypothetical protein
LFIGMIRFPDPLEGNGDAMRCPQQTLEHGGVAKEVQADFAVFLLALKKVGC